MERLWRSIKYEEVYLHAYDSVAEARAAIRHYIRFYNEERFHQGPGLSDARGVLRRPRRQGSIMLLTAGERQTKGDPFTFVHKPAGSFQSPAGFNITMTERFHLRKPL